MARSKAAKRAARRKAQAKAMAKAAPTSALHRRLIVRGRQREPKTVGPTPETLAKLEPDTLQMLHALRINGEPFIDANLVEAGHEIKRMWKIRCPNGYPSGGSGGGDEKPTDQMELTWQRWCGLVKDQLPPNELYRRCLVTPGKIADWLKDSTSCDTDPKGAAGVLKRALMWWRLAGRDASRVREAA